MNNNLPSHTLLLILIIITICFSIHNSDSHDDHNSFVFKNCSNKTEPTPDYSQTLSTLFKELAAESSAAKYFRTSTRSSEDADQTPAAAAVVSGLFQCREDITNEDCRNCVENALSNAPPPTGACGSARVQLRGCYLRYDPEEEDQRNLSEGSELLHKTCGGVGVGEGFEEMREAAFRELEEGIATGVGVVGGGGGGGLFFTAKYELVQATAQCEGGGGVTMEACECGECVDKAAEIAREECGGAFSGEVYLEKCFLSYSYYPQGVPAHSNYPEDENGNNGGNGIDGKTVAIVLGSAAALFFIFIFLLCIKSWTKKRDHNLV